MIRDLTTNWKNEIAKADMLSTGDANLVNQIFTPRTGQEIAPGSNAWAISGKRTSTGKPILANDPHLLYNFPSTWYMTHLQAPGLNVEERRCPACPASSSVTTTGSHGGSPILDSMCRISIVEQIDLNSGRYVFQGTLEQARPERELILVRGEKRSSIPIG